MLIKFRFTPINVGLLFQFMVVVAQLVEHRIVIPVVAGSTPVDHPIFPVS